MATLSTALTLPRTRGLSAPGTTGLRSQCFQCCRVSASRSDLEFSSSSSFSGPPLRILLHQVRCRGRSLSRTSAAVVPRCEESGQSGDKIPFGYTRKDVILIGVGLLGAGYGLKYALEAFGVDSTRSGNAVQLIMVLGLTVGWISTYVFRVSNKEMTYAKQLREYEQKVMQKRLEELPDAELESMLAQVEEEKTVLQEKRKKRVDGSS